VLLLLPSTSESNVARKCNSEPIFFFLFCFRLFFRDRLVTVRNKVRLIATFYNLWRTVSFMWYTWYVHAIGLARQRASELKRKVANASR
jgi:hypothetical protein